MSICAAFPGVLVPRCAGFPGVLVSRCAGDGRQ